MVEDDVEEEGDDEDEDEDEDDVAAVDRDSLCALLLLDSATLELADAAADVARLVTSLACTLAADEEAEGTGAEGAAAADVPTLVVRSAMSLLRCYVCVVWGER